ncbi:4-hydroxybenzoate 3-monooxygenase [Kordiimonas marina]|uniref:4-hydroxybenzoate 3-monooxygenase n=1 Tax=Kordiimonas marina TaxID=2872312 RepID=UPI001FF65D5D|nr:4-hydroxybenzoate 3-monooxygenase [Kordiimonas marina]MCJ9427765.1 4-hydroxybenzoate 3-monooxygenase [Kordiimonas marina]
MKTDVAIIGAGPSGLFLANLLHAEGIGVTVIERQSKEHVLSRIRAGVLEVITTDLLDRLGLSERKDQEGLEHGGFYLARDEHLIHIDLKRLTGKCVTVYGQTEVERDLIDLAEKEGVNIVWSASDVALHDVDGAAPSVSFTSDGTEQTLTAKFIAGCDGYHGPSRQAIPAACGAGFERVYPFGWLGILADVAPCNDELIYASHTNGFALASMRSPSRSRYYLQVPLDEDINAWSDDRIWDELAVRLGAEVAANMECGPSIEKSIAPLRSFVFEPMRYGNLFLAGDAAHIVPPTGAKGLNLAASDVTYLSDALIGYFRNGNEAGLKAYSEKALARVWKSERFSWYLTNLMHRFPDSGAFEKRMQDAELDYIASSEAAQKVIAENYIGLPL